MWEWAQHDDSGRIVFVVRLFESPGKPDLLRVVEEVTRTTQNDELALSVALATARILEQVFGGATVEEAVAHTLAELKNPARYETWLRGVLFLPASPSLPPARPTLRLASSPR